MINRLKYLVIFILLSNVAFAADSFDLSKLIKTDDKGNIGITVNSDQINKKLDDALVKFQNNTIKKLENQIEELQKNIDKALQQTVEKIDGEINNFSNTVNDEIVGKTKNLVNQAEKEFNDILIVKNNLFLYIIITKIIVVLVMILFVFTTFLTWRNYVNIKKLLKEKI